MQMEESPPPIQSGQTKRNTPALSPHLTPNIVPALPPEVRVHCTRTTPRPGRSTGTMYLLLHLTSCHVRTPCVLTCWSTKVTYKVTY